MQQVATVNDAFLKIAGRGTRTAWLWQDQRDAWRPIRRPRSTGE